MNQILTIQILSDEDPVFVVEYVLDLLRQGCTSGTEPTWTLQEEA